MPYIAGIFIYPIKSLDGITATQVKVLPSGALEKDREFAILDAQGRFVNGKRNAKVHLLRCSWNVPGETVLLENTLTGEKRVFSLQSDRTALESWLSDYFGFPVTVARNTNGGFPDDTISPGPTLISTATIEAVASWFPGISVEEMRQRLRANIEIDGVPVFWEDRLFADKDEVVSFQAGDVLFEGVNPCQRCVVPTRDTFTGEVYPNFQKVFTQKRQEAMPTWVNLSRFNHFYRLSVNTRIPVSEAGKTLQVGDEIKILGLCKSEIH